MFIWDQVVRTEKLCLRLQGKGVYPVCLAPWIWPPEPMKRWKQRTNSTVILWPPHMYHGIYTSIIIKIATIKIESFGDIAHGESVCLVCSRSLIQSPRNTGYLTMNTEDGLCVLHFNPHIKGCIPFLLTHIHAPSSTTVHVLALLNACATQHSEGSLQCALISVFSPCPRLIPTSLWSLRITYGSRKALWDWQGQSLSFWDRLAHPILPSM